jgi:hypothetical protein
LSILRNQLIETIGNSLILDDLRKILSEGEWKIEFDNRPVIDVPQDIKMEIVSRGYVTYEFEGIRWGNHLWAIVALGGVEDIEYGIVTPKVAFATLWYKENKKLITVDFSLAYP